MAISGTGSDARPGPGRRRCTLGCARRRRPACWLIALPVLLVTATLPATAQDRGDPPGLEWTQPRTGVRVAPGTADTDHDAPPAPPEVRVTLDEAVARVQRQVGGQVLRAQTRTIDGRVVHEVRMLTDAGHIRTLRVDAATGKVD